MKRMKLRQVLQSGRATVAALAGTAMVVGGAGAGTAALALGHSAGALSLQAPAIAVREQNVNAAGRIRVALPNGGVGVNGTVSVNNFPKTQPVSGTVNIGNLPAPQNATGSAGGATINTNIGTQTVTLLSLTGPGNLSGITLSDNAGGAWAQVALIITVDGHTVYSNGVCAPGCWYGTPVARGINNFSNSAGGGVSLFPPGGFSFKHSLTIQAATYGGLQGTHLLGQTFWTLAN